MSETGFLLFLLEVRPLTVTLPSMVAFSKQILPIKTVLSMKISDLCTMDIEHNDLVQNCMCLKNNSQEFDKGKSCLFGLPVSHVQCPMMSFAMLVTVKKLMPFDTLPDVITVGSRELELASLLNSIFDDLRNCVDKPHQTITHCFDIETDTRQKAGEIKMSISLSCLGSKVITQFSLPYDDSPYLFKAPNSPVFECKFEFCKEKDDTTILNCEGEKITEEKQKEVVCWSQNGTT